MEKNLVLKTINELLDYQFFIPHYQRGYRWTGQQVEQLLDDIDTFIPREIPGKDGEKTFYCLQPIVVKVLDDDKKREFNLNGEWFEVIDGQQRLTSIFLIIHYINDLWLGRQKKNKFKIEYETRSDCSKILNDLHVKSDGKSVAINKNNIDFFHITTAYETIRKWELSFQNRKGKILNEADFQSKFFAHCQIIWYLAPENSRSSALFERLNLGKIPLTNAELTKALFLSSNSFPKIPQEEKRVKQIEIARLWDEIEHKLNEPDLKFWSFITNKKREKFDTKIELILDIISGKTDDEKDPLFTFLNFTAKQQKNEKENENGLSAVWEEIEHFYFTLLEWYKDEDYYHKIGYLVAAKAYKSFKEVSLGELVKKSRTKTKKEFEDYIDELIRESVKVEISELRYKDHQNQIFNVLLLFNIETIRTSESTSEFYPFKQHKGNIWSLEHIHARNSENFEKTKKEPWLKWLSLHIPILIELQGASDTIEQKENIAAVLIRIEKYNNEQLTWERFSELFNEVNEIFTLDPESMDKDSEGISNLALLSQPDNSALNNSVFEIKRREIVNLDKKGSFIPVSTRRVFMKYYNEDGANKHYFFWTKKDRAYYYDALKNCIEKYLPVNHIELVEDED